jgi:Xaa-Pro dipeptidase
MDYGKRIEQYRAIMREKKIDASFLSRRFVIAYFTGAFAPWYSTLFIPVEGEPELITMAIDAPRIRNESFVQNISIWSFSPDKSMVKAINRIIEREKLSRGTVGFEMGASTDIGVFSAAEYRELTEQWPDLRFTNVIPQVTGMQLIKSSEEIELLRRAAEAVDLGLRYAYDAMEPGMTELELAGWAELGMRKAGSMFNWSITGTEIGSGYRQSIPGALTTLPGHKRLQHGDIVTVDIHSMYDNYISDLALNAIIGKPSAKQRKLADTWKTLAEYEHTLLKPGAVCGDVCKAMIAKFEELGVADKCIPTFGHGLGLDARMPPDIKPGIPLVLEENMCLVQVLQLTEAGVGGMRLEMPILITAAGCELLCKTPLDLYIKEF